MSLGKKAFEFVEGDIVGFSIQTRHLLDNSNISEKAELLREFMKHSETICKELALPEDEILDGLFGDNMKEVPLNPKP